ncbi:MAG TPA: CZB domain-containing protein [Candidatus Dorea gallistercoris]|uniref:CZB domain-containing protein n=1 Tax=Candidatus Dorea gallistercoris TaxID=2838542 RepID=A0A9D1UE22_9FIRM|nr:CZB domain-containing protein [Candidatus Dorea gallistercoris]
MFQIAAGGTGKHRLQKEKHKDSGEKTIQSQIFKGYFLFSGIVLLLVVISILMMAEIRREYEDVATYQDQQQEAQSVIAAHYKWLEQLSDSITTGADFEGSLDPETCALGQWINGDGAELMSDPEIAESLSGIIDPHEDIHLQAAELTQLGLRDKEAAYERYTEEFKPKVVTIGEGLDGISSRLQEIAEDTKERASTIALITQVLLILAGIGAVAASLLVGRRLSRKISEPILKMSDWLDEISTGIDNLNVKKEELSMGSTTEINRMMESFQVMVDATRENSDTIEQIADGDLTVSSKVRSEGDRLGKSLSYLVRQNNNAFSRLSQISESVASEAANISTASQALADSCSTQASAVEVLSNYAKEANNLAIQNADRSKHAFEEIASMEQSVQGGREHMTTLGDAVSDINTSSEQVAAVMKSIDDIAFQTNILALNAAVEAARAGSAGKGFAVVADEVRNLAAKSAEAAEQSRHIIETMIQKSAQGNKLANEANQTFDEIVSKSARITQTMREIATASQDQQEHIGKIDDEITRISSVVTENAASSEETTAATQQLLGDAENIRSEIGQFKIKSSSGV